ncbi:MAG: PEP-CTERM sorting domain-containing protein [Acetobacteraceae bacterium]|nr:PEP-CTERM sorting domain-containing protein [Acetobacteraceae bacterium]
MAGEARASVVPVSFSGPGVSGSLTLTYGTATDAKYPNGYELSGISGTFSDSNNGLDIVNAPVSSLVPINHAMPDPTNLLAPNDFSKFLVASGLPPEANGALTYDNLFYPGGSPQTASDYPGQGGVLDIYGLLFNIGGGKVVDFWSNGADPNGVVDYGVAVATSSVALDYVAGGVSVPEPGSLWLLGVGLLGTLGMFARRRHAATA